MVTKKSKFSDVSVDLETLSTAPNGAILSIGCQPFDRDTGEMGDPFYREIKIGSVLNNPKYHVEDSTLMWWLGQSEAAGKLFIGTAETRDARASITEVAQAFQAWGLKYKDAVWWGNPSMFDLSKIEHMLRSEGFGPDQLPWSFWNCHCLFTLCATTGFNKKQIKFEGTKHHAGHDAAHQAKIICAALWTMARPSNTAAQTTTEEDDEL